MALDLNLYATSDFEEGTINLKLGGNDSDKVTNGTYIVSRASSKDSFSTFVPMTKIKFNNTAPSEWSYTDYTVE